MTAWVWYPLPFRVIVYGGYLPWLERCGRFRSLGDGQTQIIKMRLLHRQWI